MTYNLHGCVGTDGRYDPERNIAVMKEVGPDIFGLQEVRRDRSRESEIVGELRAAFPGYWVLFLKTLEDDRGEYGNALVSRFPIIEHIDVDLDREALSTAGAANGSGDLTKCDEVQNDKVQKKAKAEARRAIFAKVSVHGTPLWIVVTHLGVERWARRTQARRLVASIHRHIDVTREAALLMGDLNEWRWPNAFLRYLDGIFSRHVARRTFPSRCTILPLDRIWLTGRITRRNVWAHKSRLSRRASDHLPLCVTVGLPTA